MTKKKPPDSDDIELFKAALKGTKPLTQNKVRLTPATPKRIIAKPKLEEELFSLEDSYDLPAVKSDDFISYKQQSISDKILRKLRKGQYNVEATLDLHGMTAAKAKYAVDSFLQTCLQMELRVVHIIHGKGHEGSAPVLKNKLNHWLRKTEQVLAFCSAQNKHGSRGAVYILLKKQKGDGLD
jgi:DNA-nicking Smr family endonuclease